MFWFIYKVCLEKSHYKKNWARYHKHTYFFMQSACYSCQILNKREFSQQIFEKYSNIKSQVRP